MLEIHGQCHSIVVYACKNKRTALIVENQIKEEISMLNITTTTEEEKKISKQ